MHTLLGLSSIFLVLLGCSVLLLILRAIRNWKQRRLTQFLVLTMPIATVGIAIDGFHHFVGQICFFGIPLWDLLFGVVLPLAMAFVVFGALCLGFVRLLLMRSVVVSKGVLTSVHLQRLVDALACQLHTAPPRVRLCACDRPIALTSGIWRPTILLSTWIVDHLDQREIEAVLTHELEHVAHRDYLMVFLATVLRDAFFYLPRSRVAHRQLQHEKEPVCDDLAVNLTRRPLALASALTKFWLHSVETPRFAKFGMMQPLLEKETAIHGRIQRLLLSQDSMQATQQTDRIAHIMSLLTFLALLIIQGINITIILSLMGCNPVAFIEKLF